LADHEILEKERLWHAGIVSPAIRVDKCGNDIREVPPMPDLDLRDAINQTCPWSGKPIQPDSLTLYRGHVVGFCNPGCRDKFEGAVAQFEAAIAREEATP
jgi:hypothetical protein